MVQIETPPHVTPMPDTGAAIEAALRGYVQFAAGCPATLGEAIRYSLLAGGKRLRPRLVLMACEVCGGERAAAIPAACAVEMVHCYSLIHDDLPSMDDDPVRRGQPASHMAYGEATAILAGDALLALAFEILARDVFPPATAAACCRELARAAGATALVGGQVDDLADAAGDVDALESTYRRKTAALFVASARLGARTAGANELQLDALAKYAENLGLAFQITDDLLDIAADRQPASGGDGQTPDGEKRTFPGVIGVAASRRRVVDLIDQSRAALQPFGALADSLEQLALRVADRSQA